MWKVGLGILLTLMTLGLLPFALIAHSRASQYDARPPHLVLDMDKQPRGKPQRATPMFENGQMARPQVEGTVAREDMMVHAETLNDPVKPHKMMLAGGHDSTLIESAADYAAVFEGRIRGANSTDEQFRNVPPPAANDPAINADRAFYVTRIPTLFTVNDEFLRRGQERFVIYCAPCHGESGYGDGPVAMHVKRLRLVADAVGEFPDPQDLHESKILARPDGHVFNTITNGIRNMPAYDKQISVPDRWAIVAYVRALQLSQNAPAAGAGR